MRQINKYNVYHCLYTVYRKLFKRSLLVAASLFVFTSISAQPYELLGDWSGSILLQDESHSPIELTIGNNRSIKVVDKNKDAYWFKKARLIQQQEDSSLVFWWTYNCEFGVQSKIYKLTPLSSSKVSIQVYRHTYDFYNDLSKGKGSSWKLEGSGYLLKKEPPDGIAKNKH